MKRRRTTNKFPTRTITACTGVMIFCGGGAVWLQYGMNPATAYLALTTTIVSAIYFAGRT